MPFPDLSAIRYQKMEDESRNCPVCGKQLAKRSDLTRTVVKCLNCGYSRKMQSGMEGMHRYDQPVMLISEAATKRAWFELYQPLDEQLYNMLIDAEWTPESAATSVMKDLEMSNDETQYFMDKLQFLERSC